MIDGSTLPCCFSCHDTYNRGQWRGLCNVDDGLHCLAATLVNIGPELLDRTADIDLAHRSCYRDDAFLQHHIDCDDLLILGTCWVRGRLLTTVTNILSGITYHIKWPSLSPARK